jgi:hypothetical protein
MATTKKLTTQKDLEEFFAEDNGIPMIEKIRLAFNYPYLTDLKKEAKKISEAKEKN